MENKNDDSGKEEKIKLDNLSKIDPSNELENGPKKKLLGDNSSHDAFPQGGLDDRGNKEKITWR